MPMLTARRPLTALATLACIAVATFAAGIEGCGTTGLRRVSFRAKAGGIERADGEFSFTTRAGWSVTLTDASAAVGPVYFNTLAPLEARGRDSRMRRWRELLVPLAHAHGESHLAQGRIVAEINERRAVDLLSPALVEFERPVLGVDEPVRTAELWFYNLPALGDAAVRVRGVATRGERVVPFAGSFAIDPAAATQEQPLDALRRVRGVAFDFVPEDGAIVNLRVDPRGWFADADFQELSTSPTDRQGAHVFSRRDNVGAAFEAGIRATNGTWVFRVEVPGVPPG
jgi:hypothetical protein